MVKIVKRLSTGGVSENIKKILVRVLVVFLNKEIHYSNFREKFLLVKEIVNFIITSSANE